MSPAMPAAARKVTPQDIIPDAVFAAQRKQRRAELMPIKRLRRVALGPNATVYFETFETMLFQIQEMLLIEKGGEAQLADELAAYNPLIPQGRELVATIMFEIDEPVRRAQVLASLGGVEDHFFVQIGAERAVGEQEGDIERTREDGKTSSVHFLRFPLTPAQIECFRAPSTSVMIGCDHPRYAHLAVLAPETRAELAKDFD
jgi:predicted acylesterase/phospholipase RssA